MTDLIVSWIAGHRPEIRLSLQMTIAGLAAFAAAHLLGLGQVYWAVLTAVIVLQATVGGSLKASLDRFLGTIGGAIWGVAVSVAVPHATVPMMGLALAIALIPLAVVVALWPRYRIAPVTAAIVLLGTPGESGVIVNAAERVLEIGLGSIVALAVALAVSPSRAHRLLFAAARDTLQLMGDLLALLLNGIKSDCDRNAVLGFHDRIRLAVERANTIADEVLRERASWLADTPDPEPLVRSLRRLSHDLVTISRVLLTALPEPLRTRLAVPATALSTAFGAAVDGIGDAPIAATPPPSLAAVGAAIADYQAAMRALRADGVTRSLPDDDVERGFGLAFALEQMCRNLDELASRAREAVGLQQA
jgi:uncharacterized membrane protein YccC